jgi:hypothetical protein
MTLAAAEPPSFLTVQGDGEGPARSGGRVGGDLTDGEQGDCGDGHGKTQSFDGFARDVAGRPVLAKA